MPDGKRELWKRRITQFVFAIQNSKAWPKKFSHAFIIQVFG
jgi:hypothetical protein